MKYGYALSLVALTTASLSSVAQAALITFEDLAGNPPGTIVNTQYQATAGVVFTSNPVLGYYGGAREGWVGPVGNDTLAPGEGATNGQLFISDVVGLGGSTSILTVSYDTPVNALSFDLLDIDFSENYVINVYDAGNNLLDTTSIFSGDPGTGDGIVTRVGFSVSNVSLLEVIGSDGGSGAGFGLGFDNFNTSENTEIPLPMTMLLLGVGLLGLGLRKRA